ncbi:hypothetical protein AgCh_024854 [Apium graveolens]
MSCTTTLSTVTQLNRSQIWEKIEILCEGTNKVRSNQRRILVSQYEGFMAKPKEGITEVFERFNKIINDLQLHDKYYEAEEVNMKFLLALPDHLEQKISTIREGRDLSRMTLEVLYGILKTYELEMLQRNSLKENHGHVVDGSSALVVHDSEKSEDEACRLNAVYLGSRGLQAITKPKKVKKDKAYLELEANQYKEIVEKMSVEMFLIHTSMVAATEEVSRLSKANEKLEVEKQDLELRLIEFETVKQENEYLKNKLKCASEIEAVLRKKIENNEIKLKSFRNSSQLVGQYHEKNKPCANIAIDLNYDALNSNKKNEGDKGKTTVNENVPAMLRKVDSPLFKACEVNFSEEELVIKKELADEDKKMKNEETTPATERKKKLMVNQTPKTPVKELKTENTERKKKNTNGKIEVNKSNNFAFVADAPRKQC